MQNVRRDNCDHIGILSHRNWNCINKDRYESSTSSCS